MRRGFTLVEVLMVLTMLVSILGIVWSITHMLLKMETRRMQQTEQQRIERTWTKILNDDFRSAIQDTEQLNKAEGDETIRHFGVSGTIDELRIDISDYSSRTAESSELRTVFFKFHPTSGLVRRERDYAAQDTARGAVRTAPEIVKGEFRYFDGSTWHEQWTSLERKSAPNAVEVTLYSLSRSEADRWRKQASDTATPTPTPIRVVVQIPASQGFHESYQRAQPPPPPQKDQPPPPPSSAYSPPQSQPPPPPSPSHSLFGDD
jgi:prepilin-type N-terminal cleavage/methylation domain-containing protein